MNPEITNSNQLKLYRATTSILNCGDNIGSMKASVDQMYSIYRKITEVGIENQNEEAIFTAGGKAISPPAAAHCLLEMTRTAIFLRGIYKAILQKQIENPEKRISILYAGTGPYATLITPLLTCFNSDTILIDLIDINPISLFSASKVIADLGFEKCIGSKFLEDASTFRVKKHYDIVISETMQAALKKEPQVSIMKNLIPQMVNDAIFIPQVIEIDVAIAIKSGWDPDAFSAQMKRKHELGSLFSISQDDLSSIDNSIEIEIPVMNHTQVRLMLYTNIKVFGEENLGEGDCSLTLPLRVCDLKNEKPERVRFWYQQGELPGVRFQFRGTGDVCQATGMRTPVKLNEDI
jgi:hypothetical protein